MATILTLAPLVTTIQVNPLIIFLLVALGVILIAPTVHDLVSAHLSRRRAARRLASYTPDARRVTNLRVLTGPELEERQLRRAAKRLIEEAITYDQIATLNGHAARAVKAVEKEMLGPFVPCVQCSRNTSGRAVCPRCGALQPSRPSPEAS